MGTEDVVGLGKQQVQKNNTDTAPWRAQAARTPLLLFCFLPGAQLRAGHWLADCHYGLESILEVGRGVGRIGSGHLEERADRYSRIKGQKTL